MRFGIALPQFGPVVAPGLIADFARQAEELGYESLWVGDRVLAPLKPSRPYPGHTPEKPLPPAFGDFMEPLAVDGHWELIDANDAVFRLVEGSAPGLLEPPVNVLRLSLHPDGMAPNIVNLAQWRRHVLFRLRRQADRSGDPFLHELYEELRGYPGDEPGPGGDPRRGGDGLDEPERDSSAADVVLPMRVRLGGQELSFLSTTTVFGSPLDVTVAELAIESFYPADASTAAAMHALAQ